MKTMTKKTAVLSVVGLSLLRAFGADIPREADLATMNDYFYYKEAGGDIRATHALKYSGTYTLSVDKVWSSLNVGTALSEPVILDLCGHTLTLNGCDTTQVRSFVGQDNTTVVISNGNLKTVYDPVAYPWTKGTDYYNDRRGVHLSKNSSAAVGSRLVVANGGSLILDSVGSGANVSWKGGGHRLIVEKGGTFSGKMGFAGADNRYVFKSGSTFATIASYKSGANFPQNVYFEKGYVSNLVEVCDSRILTDAGVTGLTPDASAKAGSFHCGLAVSGADFDWTGGALNVGTKDDNAPVWFEMKDGAKMTMSGKLQVGAAVGGSRSQMTMDGAGTYYKCSGGGIEIGAVANVTNVLLRLSDGAVLDASSVSTGVGIGEGSSFNAIELLSGSRITTSWLSLGRSVSYGNRVLVAGEGTSMTNAAIVLGPDQKYTENGGGRHTVTVSDHAKVHVNTGNGIKVGRCSRECELLVTDFASVTSDGNLELGNSADKVFSCSNRVVVSEGGELSVPIVLAFANEGLLMISNGTLSADQVFANNNATQLGTNNQILVSGQYGYLKSRVSGLDLRKGGVLKIAVPKDGFADRNGVPHAAVDLTGNLNFDATSEIEVDVGDFAQQGSGVQETPVIFVSNGITDALLAKVTMRGENCRLKRSGDGKTLMAVKPRGLILVVE